MPLFEGLRRRLSRGNRSRPSSMRGTIDGIPSTQNNNHRQRQQQQQQQLQSPSDFNEEVSGKADSSRFPRIVEVHAVPAGRLSPISVAEDSLFSPSHNIMRTQRTTKQNDSISTYSNENGGSGTLLDGTKQEDNCQTLEGINETRTEWNRRVYDNRDDDDEEEDSTIVSSTTKTLVIPHSTMANQPSNRKTPNTRTPVRSRNDTSRSPLSSNKKTPNTRTPVRSRNGISRSPLSNVSNRMFSSPTTIPQDWNPISMGESIPHPTALGTIPEFETEETTGRDINAKQLDPLENDTEFHPRDKVVIDKGKHARRHGTIVGRKNKNTWIICLDGSEEVNVRDTSIRKVIQSTTYSPELKSNQPAIEPTMLRASQEDREEDEEQPTAGEKYPIGSIVFIERGAHKNSSATVVGRKNKSTLELRLEDGQSSPIRVRDTSVQLLRESSPVSNDQEVQPASHHGIRKQKHTHTSTGVKTMSRIDPSPSVSSPLLEETKSDVHCPVDESRRVMIVKGVHKNGYGRIVGQKNKRTYEVVLELNQEVVHVLMTSVVDYVGSISCTSIDPPAEGGGEFTQSHSLRHEKSIMDSTVRSERSLRMLLRSRNDRARARPLNGPGALISAFGGKRVEIREDDPIPSFLNHMLPGRIIEVNQKLGGKTKEFPLRKEVAGRLYELFSAKIEDDNQGGRMIGVRSKVAKLSYIDISPCADGSPFTTRDFLLGFGDFSVLDPRKISARLELFQSTARFEIQQLDRSHFCEIEETGNVGCGFIASSLLEKICKGGKMKHVGRISAVQVRLFIPSMGIFKGMLQRKNIPSGRPGIELPPSMKKVPASTKDDGSSPAYLVVCQGGVHPSPGGLNDYLGRRFEGSLKAHKTFEALVGKKKLNDMVLTLWSSLGVPDRELKRYGKESLKPDRHNHAWVVGTVDPTGTLPPDHVYIPGMGTIQPDKIFVTRSPCLRQDHGRLLQTVKRQPVDTSNADWEFLNSLPFGSIIFSRPRVGKMSIPERIASGDLDGDLYLICWDDELLSLMNKVPKLVDQLIEDDGILKIVPSNPMWLEDAHTLMSDATTVTDIGALIGKLYTKSMKVAKESDLEKADPDAAAFADAYNEALEYKKHGRPIRLPIHLIDQMPKRFLGLLTPL